MTAKKTDWQLIVSGGDYKAAFKKIMFQIVLIQFLLLSFVFILSSIKLKTTTILFIIFLFVGAILISGLFLKTILRLTTKRKTLSRHKKLKKYFKKEDLINKKYIEFQTVSMSNLKMSLKDKLLLGLGLNFICSREETTYIPFAVSDFRHQFPCKGKILTYDQEKFFIPEWLERKLLG